MIYYQYKTIPDSVKDVSEADRRVKVAISHMGSKDLDNDVIEPGAFTKTISERGPAGANLIWHLTDHNPSLKAAVGKFSELFVEGQYLVGVTNIPKTTWGNDVLELYKSGHINQHSIGFRTIRRERINEGSAEEYQLIKEIMLYEGSAVLWGANPNTPTLGKSMTREEIAETQAKLFREQQMLVKSLRDGRFSDDAFELIEIRAAQINEAIKGLLEQTATPPVQGTAEPEGLALAETIDAIQQFRKQLTLQ